MIETPEVVENAAQLVATIPIQCTLAEIRTVMGPGIHELRSTLESQGVEVTGAWLGHHFRMPSDTFDFEIAMPVAQACKPIGRVKMSQLPAGKVARTVYHGAYEGLGSAWGEFIAWAQQNDVPYTGEFWEQYTVGPEAGDEEQYRTTLTLRLAATGA
ncbi:MAG TPA: GyrI-like domain-containing protein [Polyangiales bacterium]